ncbi:MAG: hypothetical protein U1F66_01935 [bacterium]
MQRLLILLMFFTVLFPALRWLLEASVLADFLRTLLSGAAGLEGISSHYWI